MTHPLLTALRAVGMPQRELARRTGLGPTTISLVVCGRRSGFSPSSAADILREVREEAAKRRRKITLTLGELLSLSPAQRRASGG